MQLYSNTTYKIKDTRYKQKGLLPNSCYEASIADVAVNLPQSCPTLCDPIDGSPPGSPIPGILQGRTLALPSTKPENDITKWRIIEISVMEILANQTQQHTKNFLQHPSVKFQGFKAGSTFYN